jgi:hypothetical protein
VDLSHICRVPKLYSNSGVNLAMEDALNDTRPFEGSNERPLDLVGKGWPL